MTDAEIKQLQELVALGEKATSAHLSPVFSLSTGWVIGRITDHTARPLNTQDAMDATDFACAAANARPALAALLREHAAMKKALEFYANHEHWHEIDTACLDNNPLECKAVPMVPQEEDGGTSYFADCGDNARAALEALAREQG